MKIKTYVIENGKLYERLKSVTNESIGKWVSPSREIKYGVLKEVK